MFFETVLTTEDRSYFTDRLAELTGKPRDHWSDLSLILLQGLLVEEIKKNRGDQKWNGGKTSSS